MSRSNLILSQLKFEDLVKTMVQGDPTYQPIPNQVFDSRKFSRAVLKGKPFIAKAFYLPKETTVTGEGQVAIIVHRASKKGNESFTLNVPIVYHALNDTISVGPMEITNIDGVAEYATPEVIRKYVEYVYASIIASQVLISNRGAA